MLFVDCITFFTRTWMVHGKANNNILCPPTPTIHVVEHVEKKIES